MAMWGTKPKMVTADEALPGRMSYTYSVPAEHAGIEGAVCALERLKVG